MNSFDISVELFPAGNGDAILVCLGNTNLLIDCGYKSTYDEHLRARLLEISESDGKLSRFIVTHIDADHITGAIQFITENQSKQSPTIIPIEEVWFNTYRHLQFKDKEKGKFKNKPDIRITGGLVSESTEARKRVSFKQGSSLGSALLKTDFDWNNSFSGKAVMTDKQLTFHLGEKKDVELILLGPTGQSLQILADQWYAHLRDNKNYTGIINEDEYFDDAFERLNEEIRQDEIRIQEGNLRRRRVSGSRDWVKVFSSTWDEEDTSKTNGSSITFLLKYQEKKLLFLGDAIPTQVVRELKTLIPKNERPLKVDVLKVSHHGAWRNNSPELHQLIKADYYLFSGKGNKKHPHPDFETMASILQSHGKVSKKTLVFNYRQGRRFVDLDIEEIKKKYNYDVIWPGKPGQPKGNDGYIKVEL